MHHVYSSDFYDYINAGSRRSAREFIPLLHRALPIDSLLDIGAGVGAWASEWLASGVANVVAVDGSYAPKDALLVPADKFVSHDLSTPLRLGRRFDLVQSLEVAEHLAEAEADCLMDTMTAHGDVILFSAAVPGQGGEHHVNEQPLDYWRRKFAKRGYFAYDWLRPQLAENADVQRWYRYNSIIYANAAGKERLSEGVLAACVADGQRLHEYGSIWWQLRRAVITCMPIWWVTYLASKNAERKARSIRKIAG